MLDGHFYTGLYENVIADPEVVTDKTVGRTTFKLTDVVTNPSYKTRDGDAAFLPIGTELYQVKGFTPPFSSLEARVCSYYPSSRSLSLI